MKLTFRFFLSVFLVFLAGCKNAPTKIYEAHQVSLSNGNSIPTGTLIIDARPPFEYSVSHLNGALNMRGGDFSQREEPFIGLLEHDLYFHARRLARYGISPESSVIVVGLGLLGEGEEGHMAWVLKVLGIKNVRFTSMDSFSMPLSYEPSPPRKPVTIWKPIVDETFRVDKKEFLNKIGKAVIIDVRSDAEYLGKDTRSYYSKMAPDVNAINIPWKEFLNSRGEANLEIKLKLEQVGITTDKTIFVIDEKGVRSALVTLVLRELGYAKTSNFAGGYMELIGKR